MTDLPPQSPDPQAPGDGQPQADAARPQFRALMQYVRDSSFENPAAPHSLRPGQAQPVIQLGIDLGARRIDDSADEVSLRIRATGKRGEETVFIAELLYCGLFAFVNINDAERQALQMIECPRLLFPFARQILADMTRDGGYPAVVLEPIDFAGLYRQRLQQQQRQAAGGEGGAAPVPN